MEISVLVPNKYVSVSDIYLCRKSGGGGIKINDSGDKHG